MIDLYYWPTPNNWKISILLEECGLPYRVIPVHIGRGEQFAPSFIEINPNARIPREGAEDCADRRGSSQALVWRVPGLKAMP